MSQRHDHGHGTPNRLSRLWVALALVAAYMIAEVIGGLMTNSLALLADAGHMLSDVGAIGLAIFAAWFARRPRTPDRTFGYHRTEILAALANGATLVGIALFIIVEAWGRFGDPADVNGRGMMLIAAGGLTVNLAALAVLHGGKDASLNLRGVWLHAVADTLGSAQAIAAGALIWATGWNAVDPIASVLIAILVLWSSWRLLRDSVNVLMEATPAHIDSEQVRAALANIDGVIEVHDLHIWTIASGFESLSVHLRIGDRSRGDVLREVRDLVRRAFGIEHSTGPTGR